MSLRSKLEYGLITVVLVGAITSGTKGCFHYDSYQELKYSLAQVYDLEDELRYNSPKLLTINDSELRNKRSSLETELQTLSLNPALIEARKSATEHEENGLMYLALGLLSLGSALFGGQLIS